MLIAIFYQYSGGTTLDYRVHRSLTLILFSILVYPLRSEGKDGHSATAQIVSG